MRILIVSISLALSFGDVAVADLLATWNFGTSADVATPTVAGPIAGFSIGSFSIGNSLGTVSDPINATSASSGYTGASGDNNLGNAHRIGALDTGASGSGFYSFSVTNNSGVAVELSDYDFGVRSTGTGAQAYTLRTSLDSFASDVFTGSITANSTWSFKNNTPTVVSIPSNNTAIELRLYGFNGAGSPGSGTQNTRIDDVAVRFVAVPEPTAFLFGGLACVGVGLGVYGRRLMAWWKA